MKRTFFCAVIFLITLFAVGATVYASGPIVSYNHHFGESNPTYTFSDREITLLNNFTPTLLMVKGDYLSDIAIIDSGRSLVPIRKVSNKMNYSVSWDSKTRKATLINGSITVVLTADSKTAYINGSAKTLDVPAKIINGSMYIPIRFIEEAFGANVGYYQGWNTGMFNTAWIDEPMGEPLISQSEALNGLISKMSLTLDNYYRQSNAISADSYLWANSLIKNLKYIDTMSRYYLIGQVDSGGRYVEYLVDKYSGLIYYNKPHSSGQFINAMTDDNDAVIDLYFAN